MINLQLGFLTKIAIFISVLIVLLLINTIITRQSNKLVNKSIVQKQSVSILRESIDDIESTIFRGVDLGIRGYGITNNKKLLSPYISTLYLTDSVFNRIYRQVVNLNIDLNEVRQVEKVIRNYNDYIASLIPLIQENRLDEFKREINEDNGLEVWTFYNDFKIRTYEILQREEQALNSQVEFGNRMIIYIQFLTLLIALPLFFYLYILIKKYREQKNLAIKKIEEYSKKLENYTELMSHTIRSPICTLKGLIMLLEKLEENEHRDVILKITNLTSNLDDITRVGNFDWLEGIPLEQ